MFFYSNEHDKRLGFTENIAKIARKVH